MTCPDQIAEEASPNRSLLSDIDKPPGHRKMINKSSKEVLSTNFSVFGTELVNGSDSKPYWQKGNDNSFPVYSNHMRGNGKFQGYLNNRWALYI